MEKREWYYFNGFEMDDGIDSIFCVLLLHFSFAIFTST